MPTRARQRKDPPRASRHLVVPNFAAVATHGTGLRIRVLVGRNLRTILLLARHRLPQFCGRSLRPRALRNQVVDALELSGQERGNEVLYPNVPYRHVSVLDRVAEVKEVWMNRLADGRIGSTYPIERAAEMSNILFVCAEKAKTTTHQSGLLFP